MVDKKKKLTIPEIRELYLSGQATPLDVVERYLSVIEEKDSSIQAFLHVFADEARQRAKELNPLDLEKLPLFGIPVAIKDNICTRGKPTTCASRILENYHPPYDATAVRRLLDAGAIVIGKTNLDEFAMGSSTENSAFKVTRNPWNLECAPGGSSGGSAAAVASGMVPVALGSDTGGSIRQPASFCGIVGLKGTYGRVSRYGLVAFASSLDQIGPMALTVSDSALVMEVISGHDPKDSTTIRDKGCRLMDDIERGIEEIRVAIPEGMEDWELEDSVRKATERVVSLLEESGKEVAKVSLPDFDISIACYYILANAEASSNLARYDGVRYGLRKSSSSLLEMYEKTRGEGFGEEVKRRILTGTYVLSAGYYDAYYLKAQKVRTLIRTDFTEAFKQCDAILAPVTPTVAYKKGEKTDDPLKMYLDDILTTPSNLAGNCALSVPCGFASNGLPIGLQIIGDDFQEETILKVGHAYEQSTEWHKKRPAL